MNSIKIPTGVEDVKLFFRHYTTKKSPKMVGYVDIHSTTSLGPRKYSHIVYKWTNKKGQLHYGIIGDLEKRISEDKSIHLGHEGNRLKYNVNAILTNALPIILAQNPVEDTPPPVQSSRNIQATDDDEDTSSSAY